MRNKSVTMIAMVVLTYAGILSTLSCKKKEIATASKSSKISRSYDSRGEKTDTTMLLIQGSKLSSEDVEKLEEELAKNPNDLTLRTKLLGWYSGKQLSSEPARKAYQKHILWLIKNRPDSKIAGSPEAKIYPIPDAETYYEAKKLWLEQVEAHKENTAVISNAASFFSIHDMDIAKELLKKAQALEPKNPEWSLQLGHLYALETSLTSADSKKEAAAKSLKHLEESLSLTTSNQERFYKLADLAKMAFEAGETQKAQTYANKLLIEANQYQNDWNYGNAIHHGNLILGRIALLSGDTNDAGKHLIAAGKTPGSPQLDSFGPNMMLAKELLEKGEREVVLQYFQLCASFWEMGKDEIEEWSAAVKAGRIPDFRANLSY